MIKKKTMTKKLFSKKQSKDNEKAFDSFDVYKKTMNLIDRVNLATGKKSSYRSIQGSTLNCKINTHGISSTQKI